MMKKTPALILTAIAAVLAVLALIFYLTSGVTMAYVTALSAGAIVACVLYLVLYPKLGDRQHLSLLISAAAVMAIGALGFSLIAEVETLGYLISGLRQWKDVQNWAYFAAASLNAWLLLLAASFLKPAEKKL